MNRLTCSEAEIFSERAYARPHEVAGRRLHGGLPGAALIDPFWQGLVHWATMEQPRLAAEAQYQVLKEQILREPEGERVLAEFDRLSDLPEPEVSAG